MKVCGRLNRVSMFAASRTSRTARPPANMPVVSVTMKAGIPSVPTHTPLTRPTRTPVPSIANRAAAGASASPAHRAPSPCIMRPPMTLASPTIEVADRSMPAEMRTNVWPAASSSRGSAAMRMLVTFTVEAKPGIATANARNATAQRTSIGAGTPTAAAAPRNRTARSIELPAGSGHHRAPHTIRELAHVGLRDHEAGIVQPWRRGLSCLGVHDDLDRLFSLPEHILHAGRVHVTLHHQAVRRWISVEAGEQDMSGLVALLPTTPRTQHRLDARQH